MPVFATLRTVAFAGGMLGLAETDGDIEGLILGLADGLSEIDGLTDGLIEGLLLTDGETLGETLAGEGLTLGEGLIDGEIEATR